MKSLQILRNDFIISPKAFYRLSNIKIKTNSLNISSIKSIKSFIYQIQSLQNNTKYIISNNIIIDQICLFNPFYNKFKGEKIDIISIENYLEFAENLLKKIQNKHHHFLKKSTKKLFISYIDHNLNTLKELIETHQIFSERLTSILRINAVLIAKLSINADLNVNLRLNELCEKNFKLYVRAIDTLDIRNIVHHVKTFQLLKDKHLLHSNSLIVLQDIFLKKVLPFLQNKDYYERYTNLLINSIYFLTLFGVKFDSSHNINNFFNYTLNEFKFIKDSALIKISYVSVVNNQLNQDIYKELKLQILNDSPHYFSELLKMKFNISIAPNIGVYDFIKTSISKIFLKSFKRKGLHFIKNFDFRLIDLVTLLKAQIHSKEICEGYVNLIIQYIEDIIRNSQDNKQIYLNRLGPLWKDLGACYQNEEFLSNHPEVIANLNLLYTIWLNFVYISINKFDANDLHLVIRIIRTSSKYFLQIDQYKVILKEIMDRILVMQQKRNITVSNLDDLLESILTIHLVYQSLAPIDQELETYIKKSFEKFFEALQFSLFDLIKYSENPSYLLSLLNKNISSDILNIGTTSSILTIMIQNLMSDSLKWNHETLIQAFSIYGSIHEIYGMNLDKDLLDEFQSIILNHLNTLSIEVLNAQVIEAFLRFYFYQSLEQKEQSYQIRNSLLRYFSDHFGDMQKIDFESIMKWLKRSDLLEINFDDCSQLYTKNIAEETKEYINANKTCFSEEFLENFKDMIIQDKVDLKNIFKDLSNNLKI